MKNIIKTFDSTVLILKKNQTEALKKVKNAMYTDNNVVRASSLKEALHCCGWGVKTNGDGDIISITYSEDHWRNDAEEILRAVTKHIEAGSYISMSDERYDTHWRMNFDGSYWGKKIKLQKEFIDYESKKGLLQMFNKSARLLMDNGTSIDELTSLIEQQCINIVMEA